MWMEGQTSIGMHRLILMWLFVGVTRLPATSGLDRVARQTREDGTILNRLSNIELKTNSIEKEMSEIKSRLDTLLSSIDVKRTAYNDEFLTKYVAVIQEGLISEKQRLHELEQITNEIKETVAEQNYNNNYKMLEEKTNRLGNKITDLEQTCLTCSQSGPIIAQTSPLPSTVRGVQFSGKPINYNDKRIAKSCRHLKEFGYTKEGVYRVELTQGSSVLLYCHPTQGYMKIHWPGSLKDFNKSWEEYKYGFGNFKSGWWIGNDILWQAINSSSSGRQYLRIFDDNSFETYLHDVQLSDETEGYKLHYSRSTVQSKFRQDQVPAKGSIFMTRDRESRGGNCPDINFGWWYQRGQSCNSIPSSINFQWVYLYIPL